MSRSDYEERNVGLAQTYLRGFLVSTIDRPSSGMYERRFSETLVWEWDEKTRERGRIVWQGSASEGSIRTHQTCVERIHATGSPDEPEEE